jgi:hypothetical protein
MRIGIILTLLSPVTLMAADAHWKPSSPNPLPNDTWIHTHQRLCFGVDSATLDEAIDSGVNVIVGGTNAAGYGFAGGPFCSDRDGKTIVHILTGEKIPEEVLATMRSNVDRAHARGAKVLGEVIRLHMTPWLQADHPEWQLVSSPGEKPLRAEQVKDIHVLGCWNSPYGDFFIRSQVALVQKLDYDGYNLDGFGCWATCFCSHCTAGYRADTGREIPAHSNVNESDYRIHLKWRLDRFTKFVARWTAEMKKVKRDFVCAPWSTGPGRWWHWMGAPAAKGSDTMHRVLDAPFLELLWDFPPDQGSNLLPAFTVRYYRGLTGGDRTPWILPYLCEQGQFNMQPPPVECELRMHTVLTNGGLAANGLWQQNREFFPLSRANKLIEQREPFTRGAKSIKWAAMLVGESSRLLYGIPGVRNEVPMGAWMGSGVDSPKMGALPASERRMPSHMESAVGVFRAMMEDHLPLDIIIEPDVERLETLKQYDVLILPNATCVSDIAANSIREFVQAGGGLVAMHESSLCDEFGNRRENFALSDVFGATFKGSADYSGRWPNFPSLTELYVGISGQDLHEITYDSVIRSHYRRGSDRLNYIGWATNVEIAKTARQVGRRLESKEWPFADRAARLILRQTWVRRTFWRPIDTSVG